MPSIKKVKDWYAQSFEVRAFPSQASREHSFSVTPLGTCTLLAHPPTASHQRGIDCTQLNCPPRVDAKPIADIFHKRLLHPRSRSDTVAQRAPFERQWQGSPPEDADTHGTQVCPLKPLWPPTPELLPRRYFANTSGINWPPEVREYNRKFTRTLEMIKKRHDPTVATVAQGVLEWKRSCNARNIDLDVQHWLDRFYMSRIGIRFLIGQRTLFVLFFRGPSRLNFLAFQTLLSTPCNRILTTSASFARNLYAKPNVVRRQSLTLCVIECSRHRSRSNRELKVRAARSSLLCPRD